MERIIKVIKAAVKKGASDLHIKAGDVFRARIDGKLVPLTKQRLTPAQTRAIAMHFISNETDRRAIDRVRDYDCSWGQSGIGRFRVNILRQRSSFMIVLRVVPFDMPSFESLGLPNVMEDVADIEQGLVLVSGMGGSGTTSTVAAIVNHINQSKQKHIVTIEDPLEFLHRDVKSSVTQREVGVDTESFFAGITSAVRQDPDVLVIGDLPDTKTVEMAIRSAEAGNLVISTTHTRDAVSTVNRIVEMFPSEEQDVMRQRLADVLQACVAMRLLPNTANDARVPALEVLIATDEIRAAIRTGGEAEEFAKIMMEADNGTQTFEQHLVELVKDKVVTKEVARAASPRPEAFDALVPARAAAKKRTRGRRSRA